MDLTQLKEVSQRKRLKRDAENLREEVSKKTGEIIKLRVVIKTIYPYIVLITGIRFKIVILFVRLSSS